MRPALPLVACLAFVLAAPSVHADAAALEIDILEDYLATQDEVPGMPHCARTHGYAFVPGSGPVRVPGADTNGILEEHLEFHIQVGDGPANFVPSTDDADRYGEIFLEWHEYFVALYQDWRAAKGYPPLEGWDPATPMPPSLAYPYPERSCTDGRNDDPRVPLPTWATLAGGDEPDPLFGHTHLCGFADVNQFGKSISGPAWHRPFHAGVGGDMRALNGPRDPAFWAGHQFLIDVTRTFERECAARPEGSPAEPAAAEEPLRTVPTGAAALLFAFAATAGLATTLRRRA